MKTDATGGSPAGEPGVDELLGLLASEPLRAELAGRDAAAAMFRENFRTPTPPADRRMARRDRRVLRRDVRRARLLVAAVVVLIVGGFAGAAYSAALPASVQHIAYHVLGFVGVPDAHHARPHHAAAPRPRHSQPAAPPPGGTSAPAAPVSTSPSAHPSRSATPKPGKGKKSPSPSRRPKPFRPAPPSGPVHLTATAAHAEIAAGAADTFTASLTRPDGTAIRGGQLSLIEHAAGGSGWRTVAQAATGKDGRAVLTVTGLAVNAKFRVTGPDDAQSQSMRVIVVPPISLAISAASHGTTAVLVAKSPLADPGDRVVLQVQSGGHWVSKRIRRLDQAGKARFTVRVRLRGKEYRVVLLGTVSHGRSASSPLQVPAG